MDGLVGLAGIGLLFVGFSFLVGRFGLLEDEVPVEEFSVLHNSIL